MSSANRLGLWFREIKGDIPGRPICHVFVKKSLSYDYDDAQDVVFLTPREYGPQTIENQIETLIAELLEIKAETRRRYGEYDRKFKAQ